MTGSVRLVVIAGAGILACVPPEKSLESDLRELLDEHELFHRMVFCQTGDGSRTAMCVVERNPSGPADFLEAFDLGPLDSGQPADSTLLALWTGSVECGSVGVFSPRYQQAVYRSPPCAWISRRMMLIAAS